MRNLIRSAWVVLAGTLMPLSAFAEDAHGATAGLGPLAAIGASLGIALAVIAAATAQGRIASAYMEGISRNPGAEKAMKTQLILGLAFVETLVLFALVVGFMIVGKL